MNTSSEEGCKISKKTYRKTLHWSGTSSWYNFSAHILA